jgi:hypothetical protein
MMALEDHIALTPVGKPFAPETPAFEIPEPPVVLWVILVSAALIHKVGVEEATPTVLFGETVIVPVAFPPPQPPDNKIL